MKKILIVIPNHYFPIYGGDMLRIQKICENLSADFDIRICCSYKGNFRPIPGYTYDATFRLKYVKNLMLSLILRIFNNESINANIHYSKELHSYLDKHKNDYDLIIYHLIRCAKYIEASEKPQIIEMTDVISLVEPNISQRLSVKKFVKFSDRALVRKLEDSILQKVESVILVGNTDAQYLIDRQEIELNRSKVFSISNGVDLPKIKRDNADDKSHVLFIGDMKSSANREALDYFISDIFTEYNHRIKNTYPQAELHIWGNASKKLISKYRHRGEIVFHGNYENLDSIPQIYFVGAAPVLHGAGQQNKVFDYCALGVVPLVSEIALENTVLTDGKDCLSFNNPISAIDKLIWLRNPINRNDMSKAAQEFAETKLSWERNLCAYKDNIYSLLS